VKKEQSNAWGITSFVTSIIGGLFFIMPYFGMIFSVFSLVAYAIQKPKTNLATAGLIIGIIGLLLNLAVFTILAFVIWLELR